MRFKEYLAEIDINQIPDRKFIFPISRGPKGMKIPLVSSFKIQRDAADNFPGMSFEIQPRLQIFLNDDGNNLADIDDFYKENNIERHTPYFLQEMSYVFWKENTPGMTKHQKDTLDSLIDIYDIKNTARYVTFLFLGMIGSKHEYDRSYTIPHNLEIRVIPVVFNNEKCLVIDRQGSTSKFKDGAILRAKEYWD